MYIESVEQKIINTSTYTLSSKSISAGSSETWTINAPTGSTKILGIIPISVNPTSYGSNVPAVISGLTMTSDTSAELSLRAYTTDSYSPRITMIYI